MKNVIAVLLAVALTGCGKKVETVKPTDFPSFSAPGWKFPAGSTEVYEWLDKEDDVSIARHAWGIWAGLTSDSGQVYGGQHLAVFETWRGVGELSDASARGQRGFGCTSSRTGRVNLKRPRQFAHGKLLGGTSGLDFSVLETVAYSPDAACFATSNLLFNASVLKKFAVAGDVGKVPTFPVRSIITKPTYYVTSAQHGLTRLPVWTGTPDPAKPYGYKDWNTYVFVDLDGKTPPGRKVTPATGDSPAPAEIDAATVSLGDFLSFRLDAVSAAKLNAEQDRGEDPAHTFHAGDVALLVGMHVTTKEIENWTWQTYFWAFDPAAPGLPSSPEIAKLMPPEVQGAARHYAVSPAYAMVYPNQPITGGSDSGAQPIIAFNPYLEGGFGPKVFSRPNPWQPTFQYGVQTNCMSCHALATASGKLGYSTDQYIDMKDPSFNDEVQLDFAWSIQGNLNADK